MNFRMKCLAQTVFGLFPWGEEINYWAQRNLSGTLPPSRKRYEKKLAQALAHQEAFRKYGSREQGVVYEIGCGWHLAMALVFHSFGYPDIKALDVNPHVRAELVNSILGYMKEDHRIPKEAPLIGPDGDVQKILRDAYGIDLMVPGDSRSTGMQTESIDYIYSQEVFEHIAPELIPDILAECYRVLKRDGVISLYICYSDHYYDVDKSITPYHFYRYTETAWRKYNSPLHYVNRLRHVDFLRFFRQAGFKVVEETVSRPVNWQEQLSRFPICDDFAFKYSMEELSITSARIVLKKCNR